MLRREIGLHKVNYFGKNEFQAKPFLGLVRLYGDKLYKTRQIKKLNNQFDYDGNQFYAITFENGNTDFYVEGEFEDLTNEIMNG